MSALSFRNISKVYGPPARQAEALALLREGVSGSDIFERTGCRAALRNISLEMPSGGIYCVIGLSGSGKSTLVRHVNRLIEPSDGEIWAGDVNVTALDAAGLRSFRRERVSMVFQHFGLLPHMTVAENVGFGLRVRGMGEHQRRELAAHWLNEMELGAHLDSYPEQLSGGMRQRVGLARALTADTEIILMDEAFSALDPLIRIRLQDVVLELQQRLGKTIVFITHDIDEALKMGNHIAILNGGELVQAGTPQALLDNPASDYVAEFMASACTQSRAA